MKDNFGQRIKARQALVLVGTLVVVGVILGVIM